MKVTVSQAARSEWSEGIDVVLSAQAATGVPDPSIRPARVLRSSMERRQRAADSVWLARSANLVVGCGLVELLESDHPVRPLVQPVTAARQVVELGGMAVLPQQQGGGVATALLEVMFEHARATYPDAAIIVTTWPGGVSDDWATRNAGNITPLGEYLSGGRHGVRVDAWLLYAP